MQPQSQRIAAHIADVGGIPVRRALPTRDRRTVGAWCFLDHAGPVDYPAGGGVQVELAFNPDGKPESGTDIRRRVELLGDLDDAQRQRLLQIANACPIHKVLTGEIRIDTALA